MNEFSHLHYVMKNLKCTTCLPVLRGSLMTWVVKLPSLLGGWRINQSGCTCRISTTYSFLGESYTTNFSLSTRKVASFHSWIQRYTVVLLQNVLPLLYLLPFLILVSMEWATWLVYLVQLLSSWTYTILCSTDQTCSI